MHWRTLQQIRKYQLTSYCIMHDNLVVGPIRKQRIPGDLLAVLPVMVISVRVRNYPQYGIKIVAIFRLNLSHSWRVGPS